MTPLGRIQRAKRFQLIRRKVSDLRPFLLVKKFLGHLAKPQSSAHFSSHASASIWTQSTTVVRIMTHYGAGIGELCTSRTTGGSKIAVRAPVQMSALLPLASLPTKAHMMGQARLCCLACPPLWYRTSLALLARTLMNITVSFKAWQAAISNGQEAGTSSDTPWL